MPSLFGRLMFALHGRLYKLRYTHDAHALDPSALLDIVRVGAILGAVASMPNIHLRRDRTAAPARRHAAPVTPWTAFILGCT